MTFWNHTITPASFAPGVPQALTFRSRDSAIYDNTFFTEGFCTDSSDYCGQSAYTSLQMFPSPLDIRGALSAYGTPQAEHAMHASGYHPQYNQPDVNVASGSVYVPQLGSTVTTGHSGGNGYSSLHDSSLFSQSESGGTPQYSLPSELNLGMVPTQWSHPASMYTGTFGAQAADHTLASEEGWDHAMPNFQSFASPQASAYISNDNYSWDSTNVAYLQAMSGIQTPQEVQLNNYMQSNHMVGGFYTQEPVNQAYNKRRDDTMINQGRSIVIPTQAGQEMTGTDSCPPPPTQAEGSSAAITLHQPKKTHSKTKKTNNVSQGRSRIERICILVGREHQRVKEGLKFENCRYIRSKRHLDMFETSRLTCKEGFCGRNFSRGDALKRHILTRHGPRRRQGEAADAFEVRKAAEVKAFTTEKWDGAKYWPMRKKFLQMGHYMIRKDV